MSKKGENIYKRKDGRWEARYKKGLSPNGKIIYGYCYGKTFKEARQKLEHKKMLMYTGQSDKSAPAPKVFGKYCDEWIYVSKNKLKESTKAKYSSIIEKYLKPAFGEIMPAYISTENVVGFTDRLYSENNLSPKTVRDILAVLRSVLRYVSRFDKSADSIEVYLPKNSRREIRVLTAEEQKLFVEYLTRDMDSFKFGVLFALMTGLRIGEVCALKRCNVSLDERIVRVRGTMQRVKNLSGEGGKTKVIIDSPKSESSEREIPLTSSAYRLCAGFIGDLEPGAFLLTGSAEKFIEPRIMQYHLKKYSLDCGIEGLHFHVLRHTFATRCVEVGFEIKSLSEILGHSSPRITLDRYVHSSIEFKRQNMDKLKDAGL